MGTTGLGMLIDKLKKQIAERKDQLTQTLASGSVQNYEDYQKVVGEITGLSFTEYLISDLHKDIDEVANLYLAQLTVLKIKNLKLKLKKI